MTPNNIVNMAKLMGYDMIALTKIHNSCLNCEGDGNSWEEKRFDYSSGMELCTAEDAHTILSISTVADAMEFHQYVKTSILGHLNNDAGTFGTQIIMNDSDEPIEKKKHNC